MKENAFVKTENNQIYDSMAMPGMGALSTNTTLPKHITSKDMIFFEVTGNFLNIMPPCAYSYVYGYAAKVKNGVLAALMYTERERMTQNEPYSRVSLVDEGIFSDLQQVVQKYDFSKNNGYFHYVNGLPGNFGGKINIDYLSGETISIADNQSPIMNSDAGVEIVKIINQYITEKSNKPLSCKDIVAVRYQQKSDDSYSEIRLQGEKLTSLFRFGPNEENTSVKEKNVPPEAMDPIRQMAEKYALLHWRELCENTGAIFQTISDKIVLTMMDGEEFEINERMKKPQFAGNIIFNIKEVLINSGACITL